jgi:hypothetical protein
MVIFTKSSARDRRERIKSEFWSEEIAWTGDGEKGWFRAPRTLPLILSLLSHKDVSGRLDPGRVYLDLLARHLDSGIVDMVPEGEHSFSAGYPGTRGIRTWKERMKLLEKLGFIKSRASGNVQYGHVLLIHPTIAVQHLRNQGKVPEKVWDLYRTMQIRTKEASYEQRMEAIANAKAAAAEEIAKAKAASAKAEQDASAAKGGDAKVVASKGPTFRIGVKKRNLKLVIKGRKQPSVKVVAKRA